MYHNSLHTNGKLFKCDNICFKLNCGSNDVGLSRIGHTELEIEGLQHLRLCKMKARSTAHQVHVSHY